MSRGDGHGGDAGPIASSSFCFHTRQRAIKSDESEEFWVPRESAEEIALNWSTTVRLPFDGDGVELTFSHAGDRHVGRIADPKLAAWLLSLSKPTSIAVAVRRAKATYGIPTAEAKAAIASLVARGALETNRKAPTKAADRWVRWGWRDALDFHQATRDTAFSLGDAEGWQSQLDMLRAQQDTSDNGDDEPLLDRYKDYVEAERVPLPRSRAGVESVTFGKALSGRRTCRSFSGASLPFAKFAELIEHSFSQVGEWDGLRLGKYINRASPSGGSLHPIEVYPVVMNVEGIEPGLYHYSVREHALEKLRAGAFNEEVFELAHKQIGTKNVAAAFFYTCRWQRHIWKYRYARSYRSVLFDAAHLVQTHLLTAAALDVGAFLSPALKDSKVVEFLGLNDDLDESPLYLTAVG